MKNINSGFYLYNKQIYFNREIAFGDMLLNNDFNSELQYYFNDNIFNKFDWSKEPNINISRLYKLRAQQIRDKYNYVVIAFSGGSDSTQVLMSFLKNNIFVDEICISIPEKLINAADKQILLDDRNLILFMEYEYSVKPILKFVKEKSPNTKIVIHDTSDYLFDKFSQNEFSVICDPIVTPRIIGGINIGFSHNYLHNELTKNDKNKTCLVRGAEKPTFIIENDNKLYFRFFDSPIATIGYVNYCRISKSIEPSYEHEEFFWSADMPLIPIKQSHMILNRLKNDSALLNKYIFYKQKLDEFRKQNIVPPISFSSSHSERIFDDIIYPDWNPNTFVAVKPTENPEFKLYEMVVGKNNTQEFREETKKFKEKKYEKIVNKLQFYNPIFSRSYYVGEILKC
jgi:hypothetical protein